MFLHRVVLVQLEMEDVCPFFNIQHLGGESMQLKSYRTRKLEANLG